MRVFRSALMAAMPPNHVHFLMKTFAPIAQIIQGWKSVTARWTGDPRDLLKDLEILVLKTDRAKHAVKCKKRTKRNCLYNYTQIFFEFQQIIKNLSFCKFDGNVATKAGGAHCWRPLAGTNILGEARRPPKKSPGNSISEALV